MVTVTRFVVMRNKMKKFIMAFLLVWSSLSADLPEKIEQLHQSLTLLRARLTMLQEGLSNLKRALNNEGPAQLNDNDSPSQLYNLAMKMGKQYPNSEDENEVFDNYSFFANFSLKLQEQYATEDLKKDFIKSEIIQNLAVNLKIISKNWSIATDTFYTAVMLSLTNQDWGFAAGWITLKNLKKFYDEFNQDAITTAHDARFKAAWYDSLGRLFHDKKIHFKVPKKQILDEDSSADELQKLEAELSSFNPDPGTVGNVWQYVEKWCSTNKDSITSTVSKNITPKLFSIVINFFKSKDISYFKSFGGAAGDEITNAITYFFSRAIESDISYANALFQEIIEKMNLIKSMNIVGQEKNQIKHQLFYLCFILLKNNYFEPWLMELTLDLLIRNSGSYDKNGASIEWANAFLHISEKDIAHLLQQIFDHEDKKLANRNHSYTLPDASQLELPSNFFDSKFYDDSFRAILSQLATILFQRVAYKKVSECTNFLLKQQIIQPQPVQPAPVHPKPAIVNVAEPAEVPGVNIQAIEEIQKDYPAWQQKNIDTKDYSYSSKFLNDCLQLKNVLSPHNQAYKKALSNCSDIVKNILKNREMLELLIQEAISVQSKNLFKQLVEFSVWMINEAGQDYFLNNLDRITSNNLDVADASLYMLVQRNNLNAIVYQENLVKHLILGLAGNPNQKKAAQEVFVKIPAMGSIYRRKLATWFRELGGEAAV